MRQILVIHSSPNLSSSITRQITGEFIKTLAARHPGVAIVTRDLGGAPVPHIDEAAIAALRARGGTLSPDAEAALARSDALIAELERFGLLWMTSIWRMEASRCWTCARYRPVAGGGP